MNNRIIFIEVSLDTQYVLFSRLVRTRIHIFTNIPVSVQNRSGYDVSSDMSGKSINCNNSVK